MGLSVPDNDNDNDNGVRRRRPHSNNALVLVAVVAQLPPPDNNDDDHRSVLRRQTHFWPQLDAASVRHATSITNTKSSHTCACWAEHGHSGSAI